MSRAASYVGGEVPTVTAGGGPPFMAANPRPDGARRHPDAPRAERGGAPWSGVAGPPMRMIGGPPLAAILQLFLHRLAQHRILSSCQCEADRVRRCEAAFADVGARHLHELLVCASTSGVRRAAA